MLAFLISVALDSVLDSVGDPVGGCGGKSMLTLLSSSMHWNLCAQPYNRHFTSERESHSHRHSEGRIRVFVHSPDLICYTLVPPNRFPLRFLKWNKIPNSTKIGVRWRNCEIQICCYFSGPQLLEWGRGARSYSLLC